MALQQHEDHNMGLASNFFLALTIVTLTVSIGKLITDYYFCVIIATLAIVICAIEAIHQGRVRNRMTVTSKIERRSYGSGEAAGFDQRRKTVKIKNTKSRNSLDDTAITRTKTNPEIETIGNRDGSDLQQKKVDNSKTERVNSTKRTSEKKSHGVSPFKRISLKRNKDRFSLTDKPTTNKDGSTEVLLKEA